MAGDADYKKENRFIASIFAAMWLGTCFIFLWMGYGWGALECGM